MTEDDSYKYMMAHEKMINLIFTFEQTLAFLEDYAIEPDDEADKILGGLIERLKKWQKVK